MKRFSFINRVFVFSVAASISFVPSINADQFTQSDLDAWQAEYKSSVKEGRKSFTDGNLGTNGLACAQCHPNAANTHPETYPKFQKQLGKVTTIGEMINWCIRNPLEGKNLALDSKKMVSMIAYITEERRKVSLNPGKH